MKNVVSWMIDAITFSLFLVITISIIACISIIGYEENYHKQVIVELESSDFSSSTISKYQGENEGRTISIANKTVYEDERIYEVSSTYTLKMPILNFSTDRTITGYAR